MSHSPKKVSRFEIIDKDGRQVVKYGDIELSFQDDLRTLKVFMNGSTFHAKEIINEDLDRKNTVLGLVRTLLQDIRTTAAKVPEMNDRQYNGLGSRTLRMIDMIQEEIIKG